MIMINADEVERETSVQEVCVAPISNAPVIHPTSREGEEETSGRRAMQRIGEGARCHQCPPRPAPVCTQATEPWPASQDAHQETKAR